MAAKGLTVDDGEEHLDQVESGRRGRREVQHDPRVLGQPALHHRLLVAGVVVTDHLQPAARIGTGDLLEEGQELAVATIMSPRWPRSIRPRGLPTPLSPTRPASDPPDWRPCPADYPEFHWLAVLLVSRAVERQERQ